MKNRITVRVPATSANLGASFDCLGLALNLYCDITVERSGKDEIIVTGLGKGEISENKTNLVYKAIKFFCEKSKITLPKLKITINNNIPIYSGLGSSAAAIAGGLFAACALLTNGRLYSKEDLLDMSLYFESHPDNLAPAFLGGLNAASVSDKKAVAYRFDEFEEIFKHKAVVVLIPKLSISTDKSRVSLFEAKTKKTHKDYVEGMTKAVANIIALAKGRFSMLHSTMNDKVWHQVQRKRDMPFMDKVFKSARKAGADGSALSGSGPVILSICDEENADAVGKAMIKAFGKDGAYKVLKPDYEGVRCCE
ncbi:MAG: homoserine kinase [Elusimicrobiota bacterium]